MTQVPSPKVVMIRLLPKEVREFRTPGVDSGFCRSSDSGSSASSDSEEGENLGPRPKVTESVTGDQQEPKSLDNSDWEPSRQQDERIATSILKDDKALWKSTEEAGIPGLGYSGKNNGASRSRQRKRAATNDADYDSDVNDDDDDDGEKATPLKRVKRVRRRKPKVEISGNERSADDVVGKSNLSIANTTDPSQCDAVNSPRASLYNKDSNLCPYCLKHFSSAQNVLRHIKLRCPVAKNLRSQSNLG